MTCAKKVVTAVLTTPDGGMFIGTNACAFPQATCPRLPGEGYDKCLDICGQYGHAEEDALAQCLYSWHNPWGGLMKVSGIRHVCQRCQERMAEYGVSWVLA